MTPTFFLLDAGTSQPVCFTIGSAARRATQAAPELLALAPMTSTRYQQARWRALPEASFQRHWAGYATTKQPYALGPEQWEGFEFVQRSGERSQAYQFKGYFCSADRSAMETLALEFPKRWHIEEFFKVNQALGWHPGSRRHHRRHLLQRPQRREPARSLPGSARQTAGRQDQSLHSLALQLQTGFSLQVARTVQLTPPRKSLHVH